MSGQIFRGWRGCIVGGIFFSLAATIVGIVGFISPQPYISGFVHQTQEKKIGFVFHGWPQAYYSRILDSIPEGDDFDEVLLSDKGKFIGFWGSVATLDTNFSSDNEYSVLIYATDLRCEFKMYVFMALGEEIKDCPVKNTIEIVRQPKKWLKTNFDIDAEFGHSILGRRDMPIKNKDASSTSVIRFKGAASIPEHYLYAAQSRLPPSTPSELLTSAAVMDYLWSHKVYVGSGGMAYSEFLALSPKEKLNKIESSEINVSCGAVRDLFLHLLLGSSPGIKARAVDAVNYQPQFKDLQAYSHALVEVFINSENRYVLVDPWNGFSLNLNGKNLSANDLTISEVRSKSNEIEIIKLIPNRKQFYAGAGGSVRFDQIYTGNININKFSFNSLVHNPSYVTYFSSINYRDAIFTPN